MLAICSSMSSSVIVGKLYLMDVVANLDLPPRRIDLSK